MFTTRFDSQNVWILPELPAGIYQKQAQRPNKVDIVSVRLVTSQISNYENHSKLCSKTTIVKPGIDMTGIY